MSSNFLCASTFLWLFTTFLVCPARAQSPQEQPSIRVQATSVPVDVIVLDREGNPVRDLSRDDFVILEDGMPQEIAHFSLVVSPRGSGGRAFGGSSSTSPVQPDSVSTPVNPRIFLIVLGRGRHHYFDAMDKLIGFVRQELDPSDVLAVVAYNRASDFTNDHEAVAAVLERYNEAAPAIESRLNAYFSGTVQGLGITKIPRWLQGSIDAIFVPPDQTSRSAAIPMSGGSPAVIRASDESNTELRFVDELFTGLPFKQFVENRVRSTHDIALLDSAVQYLRYIEGDKNLLLFTEQGAWGVDPKLASDGRVRVHTFQTGGVQLSVQSDFTRWGDIDYELSVRPTELRLMKSKIEFEGARENFFAIASVRNLSKITGGLAYIYSPIEKALTSMLRRTEAVYLLGYQPKNQKFDGRFRSIEVQVKRKGVRVFARGGYFGHQNVEPASPEQNLTRSRTLLAANNAKLLDDIKFSFEAVKLRSSQKVATGIEIRLSIQPEENMFTLRDNLHRGKIAITYFFASREGELWERWDTLEMDLSPAIYKKIFRRGIQINNHFEIPGRFRKGWLKVVLHDSIGDQVGSQAKEIF